MDLNINPYCIWDWYWSWVECRNTALQIHFTLFRTSYSYLCLSTATAECQCQSHPAPLGRNTISHIIILVGLAISVLSGLVLLYCVAIGENLEMFWKELTLRWKRLVDCIRAIFKRRYLKKYRPLQICKSLIKSLVHLQQPAVHPHCLFAQNYNY